MSFEEEKIKKSKDEIKFYIENLKMLDEKVEVGGPIQINIQSIIH